jgi:deaminated glutathione amidase
MTRIAVLQMCSGIDTQGNADTVIDSIAKAAAGRAKMLFTPEMTGLLDRDRERASHSVWNEAEDPVLAAIQVGAKKYRLWVSVGSLALRSNVEGKFINCSLMIDDRGVVRARYSKMHLFDVNLASGESWRESSAYSAGPQPVVSVTPFGRVGMSVCYDLRFPSLYQQLSKDGAEILSIPSAFTVPTGTAHWHVLMRARAIENACWVVAAAQSGHHGDGRDTFGHSLVVDPWGEVVLDMQDGEGLGFADIDLAQVVDARTRIPVIDHRRPIPAALLAS